MKLSDLRKISDLLHHFNDFFTTNSDGDETGLSEETEEMYLEVKEIINNEFYKIHLRNELAKVKRKYKK